MRVASQYAISFEEVLNVFSIANGKMCITAVKKHHLIAINPSNYRMEASIKFFEMNC